MTIRYKAAGKDRKRLAKAIADHLERELEYMGAPTFAYRVDFYTIDRNSNLIFDDRADTEEIPLTRHRTSSPQSRRCSNTRSALSARSSSERRTGFVFPGSAQTASPRK